MNAEQLTITEQEDLLFQEWRKQRDNFCEDGIIDEVRYKTSTPRIMLILKEVNSKEAFNLRAFLLTGARSGNTKDGKPRHQTWDNVARWVYGIKSIDKDFEWVFLRDRRRRHINTWRDEFLPTLCVMNIKKSSGRNSTNHQELKTVAAEDATLIQRQFALYNASDSTRPSLIIACGKGVAAAFINAMGKDYADSELSHTSQTLRYWKLKNGSVLIDFYHPQARVSHQHMFEKLIGGFRELMGELH